MRCVITASTLRAQQHSTGKYSAFNNQRSTTWIIGKKTPFGACKHFQALESRGERSKENNYRKKTLSKWPPLPPERPQWIT